MTKLRLNRNDLLAIGALIILSVAFFWKMTFTDLILPRGDVFAYFYPYWDYRNEIMQLGRIPLWNPYLFMGAPFLANSQAGVLYPPNWLLIGFNAPTAVKIAIVMHVAWAAVGMYLLARRTFSLKMMGAMLASITFALGGYLTAQVEHVNQLQGLAWLPWLFWLWSEVIGGKWKSLLWLGLAFAMQLLAGHTQSAFISGVGLGVWALWEMVGRWKALTPADRRSAPPLPQGEGKEKNPLVARWRNLLWPVGIVATASVLALVLAAVQLLPTMELTRLSNRSGGLGFLEAVSFSFRPTLIGRGLLPNYHAENLFTEYVAYVGIVALVLALIGAWNQRRDHQVVGLVILAGVALFLAFGAYNPVYWQLVRFVPGFDLFRAPARWLALWGFAVALLAGIGFERAQSLAPLQVKDLIRRLWPGLIVLGLMGLAFLAPLELDEVIGATRPGMNEVIIWVGTLVLGLALIVTWGWEPMRRFGASAVVALVTVELFVASQNLPYNNLSAPSAWSSQRPAISTLLAAGEDQTPPDRFLSLSDILFDPGDLREIEAIYGPYLTDQALFDYVIAAKQKEIIAPNLPMAWEIPSMDGFDGGILPTRDYIQYTALFLDEEATDGRLREFLENVPDLPWLEMANVRWIITDKIFDAWVNGVYYDLQFPASSMVKGETSPPAIEAYPPREFEATAVGIIGHIEGAESLPDGTQIGSVEVPGEGELPVVLPLLVGEHLAEGLPGDVQHSQPEVVGYFTPDQPELGEYHALISWGHPLPVEQINISVESSFPGKLVIRGVTLIDERSGAFQFTSLSQGNVIRLAHSAEVKIYEYDEALPRAYLVCEPEVVGDQEQAWVHLAESPDAPVIVAEGDQALPLDCMPGTAAITRYEPERVEITVDSPGAGAYLILSDAWYPGWEATVDGQAAEIYWANGLFRAVSVPNGQHEVTFTYRSRPFVAGGVISLVSLLSVVIGLFWPGKRETT